MTEGNGMQKKQGCQLIHYVLCDLFEEITMELCLILIKCVNNVYILRDTIHKIV